MFLRGAFALVLNLRSGMPVHQPTYENLVARLCVIQERGGLVGAGVGSASMALCIGTSSGLYHILQLLLYRGFFKNDLLAGK